jgi:hypothetical protein
MTDLWNTVVTFKYTDVSEVYTVSIIALMIDAEHTSETCVYFNETTLRYIPESFHLGRAMAQVVSRRPLTAEALVRARVNPCGICGGQSGTGSGFSPSSSVFPCQYHSTVALQTRIIWGMRNVLT